MTMKAIGPHRVELTTIARLDAADVDAHILVRRGIIEEIQFAAHETESPDIRSFMDEVIGKHYDSEYTN